MGMDYHLECSICNDTTMSFEYSIVGRIESKHPDECEQQVKEWTEFLVKHSGHCIKFCDSKRNETNPADLTGGYVLGLTNTVGNTTYEKMKGVSHGKQ